MEEFDRSHIDGCDYILSLSCTTTVSDIPDSWESGCLHLLDLSLYASLNLEDQFFFLDYYNMAEPHLWHQTMQSFQTGYTALSSLSILLLLLFWEMSDMPLQLFQAAGSLFILLLR